MGNSSSAADDGYDLSLPGEIRTIPTHLGDIKVRVFGEMAEGKIPVICLHGAKIKLLEEWVPTAVKLAEKGHPVCIINFHSNPLTIPSILYGGISAPDLAKVVLESVMKGVFNSEKMILVGKSWGGFMGSALVAENPEPVVKAVFQAPAFTSKERVAKFAAAAKCPLLLCWAKDDPMMSYSSTKIWMQELGEERATLYTAEKGGHAVTDEYIEPITKFLEG